MIFLWAHCSVGSLSCGMICLRDVFVCGLVFLWVERALELLDCSKLFVLYIIRDVAAILIIGSSTQVALTCGVLLLIWLFVFLLGYYVGYQICARFPNFE